MVFILQLSAASILIIQDSFWSGGMGAKGVKQKGKEVTMAAGKENRRDTSSKITTDPGVIKEWVESSGGHPAQAAGERARRPPDGCLHAVSWRRGSSAVQGYLLSMPLTLLRKASLVKGFFRMVLSALMNRSSASCSP